MSIKFFVNDMPNKDGKYAVLQEDSETAEPFGVKDFDTKEEAQRVAEDMQRTMDYSLSEKTTGDLPDIACVEDKDMGNEGKFRDTHQDLSYATS